MSNWKNIYYDDYNQVVNEANAKFVSEFGSFDKGTGTRENPLPRNGFAPLAALNYVIGNGAAESTQFINNDRRYTYFVTGQDMLLSRLVLSGTDCQYGLRNLTLMSKTGDNILLGTSPNEFVKRPAYRNCCFKTPTTLSHSFNTGDISSLMANSLVLAQMSFLANSYLANNTNNTFVGNSLTTAVAANPLVHNRWMQTLFHECDIAVTQGFANSYKAFNNCRFKIGNEATYTKLQPASQTENGYRQAFVDRCTVQSINTDNANKYCFANNAVDSTFVPKRNSIIDNWAIAQGIYVGYRESDITGVPITAGISPQSFNDVQGVSKGMTVSDNLITLSETADVSTGATKQSSLIVFNGIKSISSLSLQYNLPASVMASTVRNVQKITLADVISGDTNYIVASANANTATVRYNGTTYSSDRSQNNYIIRGVAGGGQASVQSGSPVLFRVLDLVGTPSVGVRVATRPLVTDVASGSLKTGYWYLVSATTETDTAGTVTYDGRVYPVNASFIATSAKSFAVSGNCRLDEVFADDETQNPFVDMYITRPVAAMTNLSKPKIGSDGKAVGSSHFEFDMLLGQGYMEASPQGRIMQLKVGIITSIG